MLCYDKVHAVAVGKGEEVNGNEVIWSQVTERMRCRTV